MHDPHEPHLALVKRILRYVKGTLSSGLHIGTGRVDSLTAYSNADWAGCPDSRRLSIVYTLATILCLGHPNARPPSLALVLKLSTELLHMLWQNVVGCASCFRSFTCHSLVLPLSIVIMLAQFT